MSRKSAIASDDGPPLGSGANPPVTRVFGEPRFHTDGEVMALAFGANGDLWSVEEPGRLREWNTATGQPVQSVVLSDLETLWQFSPDARVVVSASDEVSLWETSTGQLLTSLPQPSWVDAVALWGNPATVATGHDDGVVRIWDVASGRLVRELGGHDRPIGVLAFSPDGTRLASAGEDRIICIWEVATGRHLGTLTRHTDHIHGLAWRPDGKILVSAAWDRTARVWDTQKFEPVILLNTHADQVTALSFSPDGKFLATADSAHTIRIWDPLAGKELHVLGEHTAEIRALAFTGDGNMLASGGADCVIRFWDPRQGQLLSAHDRPLLARSSLAVMAGGSRLASSCGGAGLQIWEIATGKAWDKPPAGQPVTVLAASPDGKWLATGQEENRVHVWNAATLQQHKVLEGLAGQVGGLAFSPDSNVLACVSTSDGTVWLWNVSSGEPMLVIPLAADACTVECIAFHPNGAMLAAGGIDWLATGGSDGALCLWDVAQRAPIFTFNRGATALAFHPSGRWLASASLDESVWMWDITAQKPAFELTGHSDEVTCVAYSPDGRWLVSGSDDRSIRIWNAESGDLVAVQQMDTPIKAVCFSPDGRFLFTGNGNTTSYQIEVRVLTDEARPALADKP